jgi:hypothetical protein
MTDERDNLVCDGCQKSIDSEKPFWGVITPWTDPTGTEPIRYTRKWHDYACLQRDHDQNPAFFGGPTTAEREEPAERVARPVPRNAMFSPARPSTPRRPL